MKKKVLLTCLLVSALTLCTGCTTINVGTKETTTEAVKTETTAAAPPETVRAQTTAAPPESVRAQITASSPETVRAETTVTAVEEGVDEIAQRAEQNQAGEGIGESTPLTAAEKDYVRGLDGKAWFLLTEEEKSNAVVLMGRWWDIEEGYIVPDYNGLQQDLDFQMGTYEKNGVTMGVLETACDIYGRTYSHYTK